MDPEKQFERQFEREYRYKPYKKYNQSVTLITKDYLGKPFSCYVDDYNKIEAARQKAFNEILDDILILCFKNQARKSFSTGSPIGNIIQVPMCDYFYLFRDVDCFVRRELFRNYSSPLFSLRNSEGKFYYFYVIDKDLCKRLKL